MFGCGGFLFIGATGKLTGIVASGTAFALVSFFVRFFLGALCLGAGDGVGAMAGDIATIGDIDLFESGPTEGGGGVGITLGLFDGGRVGKTSGVRGFMGDIATGSGGTLPGFELINRGGSVEPAAFR